MRKWIVFFLLLSTVSGYAHPQKEDESAAVMIHGCHLQAKDWEMIVFGSKDHWGRVPTGIQEALKRQAQAIFWGTGASEVDGVKEAQYTYDLAVGEKLQQLGSWLGVEPERLKLYLENISYIDTESKNTTEELAVAIKNCHQVGINNLILVSSPTHLARCLQEACKLDTQGITIYATPSQTCFYGSTAGDVTIFEPPHRPESFNLPPFYKTVKRFFGFYGNPELAWELQRELDVLLTHYELQKTERAKVN